MIKIEHFTTYFLFYNGTLWGDLVDDKDIFVYTLQCVITLTTNR